MGRVLNFEQFISENDDNIDKEFEDYIESKEELCPRCGEPEERCSCSNKDHWSTYTFHRVPKGKDIKSKPKQEFKK